MMALMKKSRSTLKGRKGSYDKMSEELRTIYALTVPAIVKRIEEIQHRSLWLHKQTREELVVQLALLLAERIIDA